MEIKSRLERSKLFFCSLILRTFQSLTDIVNKTRKPCLTISDLNLKDGEGKRSQSIMCNYRYVVEHNNVLHK